VLSFLLTLRHVRISASALSPIDFLHYVFSSSEDHLSTNPLLIFLFVNELFCVLPLIRECDHPFCDALGGKCRILQVVRHDLLTDPKSTRPRIDRRRHPVRRGGGGGGEEPTN
jgi:hypothetical protein